MVQKRLRADLEEARHPIQGAPSSLKELQYKGVPHGITLRGYRPQF